MSDETRTEDWTMSVPAAGRKFYGAGRDKSYEMAKTGGMPVIKLGKTLRAVVPAIKRQLQEAGQEK